MEDCIGMLNSHRHTAVMTLVHQAMPPQSTKHQQPVDNIYLGGGQMVLGRSLNSDIVVNCIQISRRHCRFEYRDGKWWIEDLSTNGVALNETFLTKGIQSPISHNDLVNVVPSGILTYRFQYAEANPVSNVAGSSQQSSARAPSDSSENDEDNLSDSSESILRAENNVPAADDRSVPTVPVGGDDDLHFLASVANIHGKRGKHKASNSRQKRRLNVDILKPKNTRLATKERFQPKRRKPDTSVICLDDDDEELLDLDDPIPIPKFTSPQKVTSQTSKPQESEDIEIGKDLKTKVPENPMSKIGSTVSESDKLDCEVLNTQLAFFMNQCKQLKNERALFAIKSTFEKDQLQQDLNDMKVQLSKQMEFRDKSLGSFETELNCCICNEAYIQPAAIDCGHAFCKHCITEWKKKKSDCPICRQPIRAIVKLIELHNLLDRFYSLCPDDIQKKRNQLIKDREDEVRVVEATSIPAPTQWSSGMYNPQMAGQSQAYVQLQAMGGHGYVSFPHPGIQLTSRPRRIARAPVAPATATNVDASIDAVVRGNAGVRTNLHPLASLTNTAAGFVVDLPQVLDGFIQALRSHRA